MEIIHQQAQQAQKDLDINNMGDFPQMPKAASKIATCITCQGLGFNDLEVSHTNDKCMRCIKCHTWRTCGQKKHDNVCSGKPPKIEIVVKKEASVDESSDEEREIGRTEEDPDFVEDCRHFWEGSNGCRRGDLCDFAHQVVGKSAHEVSGSKRNWIADCINFFADQGCSFGDSCRFSHSGDGISAKEKSGNIVCIQCNGPHHIANCKATCGNCGSNKHGTERCIQCFNCDSWGHHIKACKSGCGYCGQTNHKQPQCFAKREAESFCDICEEIEGHKVKGHSIRAHCRNCSALCQTNECQCQAHVKRGQVRFQGPNKI
jgi:hypothetical protein